MAVNHKIRESDDLIENFLNIELVSVQEYKNGGQYLNINYSFQPSIFGELLVASTDKGICNILYFDDKIQGLSDLKGRWKDLVLVEKVESIHLQVADFLSGDLSQSPKHKIKLHLHGTEFQLKVWTILLSIPFGKTTNYGAMAAKLGNSKMSRAVGAAIGRNPVAYLIPCHRVIASTGAISGYRWGVDRKRAMLEYEARNRNLDIPYPLKVA